MLLFATAALFAAANPSAAKMGDEQSDLKCLAAVSYVLSETKATANQGPLQMAALYFAGKIFGRDPGIDLTAKMKEAITSFGTKVPLEAEMTRCGNEMAAAGERLTATGNALQAK